MTSNTITTEADLTVEEVWRRFGAELRVFVRRRVSDSHRADDLVADILLRVNRKLGSLEDHDRLGAWLFGIARNAIIDEYRRAGVNREVLDAAPGERLVNDVGQITDAERVQRELANCLRPLLDGMSPAHRRALQLTELDGVTQVAAAEQEGVSVSGMKSRVQRARKELAGLLNQCCTLTLDARGLPTEYTPPAHCQGSDSVDKPAGGCGCS